MVHGPKVGGDVGSDVVGRDKTTVHGDQVGRDQQIGGHFEGHNITADTVIIQQQGEAAARVAASRFQLSGRNPDFEGRREETEEIKAALRAGAAQITALEGMGGIGKTDTAIEAAHDLIDEGRFKNAQLFIDLQGFSASGQPLALADALRRLLRPFVSANETLPESEQDLAARFREATRGLDMLLFLDNARDDEQVELLLPGHPTCTTLITSRNRLALPGLKPIDLAEMDPREATALALKLGNRRDRDRLNEAQACELARLCGYLPISIEVTASALSKSRGADVAGYFAKLGERTKPLAALEKAKAVLRFSVEALDAEARARWSALGVFDGGFIAMAAAAIWAVEDAGATLDELEQRSLMSFEPVAQRYHLHDLLRAVALEELARNPARQHEIQLRHVELFYAALAAADRLYLAGHDDVGRGLALLDAELANIRAAQCWAADAMSQDERAAVLAQGFPNHDCLWVRMAPDEHLRWLETSLTAAERSGDRDGQARTVGNLGVTYRMRGEIDRAQEMLEKALAIAEQLGLKEGMAAAYGNLGLIYRIRGDLDRAEDMHKKGFTLNEGLDRKEGMADDYAALALVYEARGDLAAAERMHLEGLAIEEELGRRQGIARQCTNLGSLSKRRGEVVQAVVYWRKALAFFREIGARSDIEKAKSRLRAAGIDPDRDAAA